MNEIKKNFSKWMYWFMLAVSIILVYKFFDNFTAIGTAIGNFLEAISPFLAGALLAYLLYIPESRIEKKLGKSKKKFLRKRARGISVFLTFTIAILVIIVLVNVILPIVSESIVELVNNFQNYWNSTMDRLNSLPEDSILKNEKVVETIKSLGKSLQEIDLTKYINYEKITEYIKGAVGVASGIFDVFVTIVVSVYILLFNEKICNTINKYLNKTNEIFFKFISGQLIDAVVVGVLVTIAMSIIGVKYSVLLGFMIGLFNVIPYFGAIFAVAISVLITVITGGLSQAIIMAIVVIILQQIDSNIINPKILGSSLDISQLIVIGAVALGGAYFGVLGMFLGVPVATVLKIIICDWVEYKNKQKYNY